MFPLKNSLAVFYVKFMTLFDVFYSNLLRSETVRVFYTKFHTHLRCFSSRFMLKSFEPEPAHDRLHAIFTP
jgi:predicted membrane protein